MMLSIKQAKRSDQYVRIGIIGPSGSGKTYTALRLARGLVGATGRILVVDSERGSASLYADMPECAGAFDVIELDSYSPEVYTEAIKLAEREGYGAVVVDSLSHAWMGKDGALELVDRASARGKGNLFAAWRDVTPLHQRMIDAIVSARCHVIATMRSKVEWVLEQHNGKTVPRKIGMQPVQRDGMEYEFTLVGDMDDGHNFCVTKSRIAALSDRVFPKPNGEITAIVLDWLAGADTTPATDEQTNPKTDDTMPRKKQLYAAACELAGDDEPVREVLRAQGCASLANTPVDVLADIVEQFRERATAAAAVTEPETKTETADDDF